MNNGVKNMKKKPNHFRLDGGCTNGNTYEGTVYDAKYPTREAATEAAIQWRNALCETECPRGEKHIINLYAVDEDGDWENLDSWTASGVRVVAGVEIPNE